MSAAIVEDRVASPGSERTRRLVHAVIVLLVAVYCLIGMRNFMLRAAQVYDDDTPAFFAMAYADPARFAGDVVIGLPIAVAVPIKVATSAMVWIPAMLWRYLHVDAYAVMWLLTFLQALGIGAGVYALSVALVRSSRTSAALAVVFAYAASPWAWAPTNYAGDRSWIFLPYPANFAIGPALLAFACLVRGRNAAALVALGVVASIHPGLAVFASVVLGCYWLLDAVRTRSAHALKWTAGLIPVGALAVVPAFVAQSAQPDRPLPVSELMAGFRHNQHVWPWSYHGQFEYALGATVAWLAMAILAWRARDRFAERAGRLWFAALAAAVGLGIGHVAGAVFQVPLLLNLIGLRSWMWVALISLPMIAAYWVTHIERGHPVAVAAIVLALALPLVAGEYAIFWPVVVCLALVDLSQSRLSTMTISIGPRPRALVTLLAAAGLIGWAAIVLLVPVPPPGMGLLVGYSRLPASAAWIVVGMAGCAACVALIAGSSRRATAGWRPAACALIVATYAGGTGWVAWRSAEKAADPQSSDAMAVDIQLWARDHTPARSVFLVPVPGWRTLTQRRAISPFTRENYAYFVPRSARQWRDRLVAFYGISPAEAEAKRGAGILVEERERFRRFGEADFMRFATEFGASHLLLPLCYPVTDRVTLDLPLAYRNRCYAAYALDRERWNASLREREAQRSAARTAAVAIESAALLRLPDEAVAIGEHTRTTIPAASVRLPAGSLSMWARIADPARPYADLVRVNDSNDLYVYRQADGSFVAFYNGIRLATASGVMTDRNWHHYAFTWTDGEQKLFLDGREVASGAARALAGRTTGVAIGWLGARDGEQWVGAIAKLATFARTLSAGEVAALHQAGAEAIDR